MTVHVRIESWKDPRLGCDQTRSRWAGIPHLTLRGSEEGAREGVPPVRLVLYTLTGVEALMTLRSVRYVLTALAINGLGVIQCS